MAVKHPAVAEDNERADEPDSGLPHEDKVVVWAFLWTLFVFKMATVFLIYWASKSFETGAILTATTWPWLVLPLVACFGPLVFRYRLLKVRARRDQLRRAEWMVDVDSEADSGQTRAIRRAARSIGPTTQRRW